MQAFIFAHEWMSRRRRDAREGSRSLGSVASVQSAIGQVGLIYGLVAVAAVRDHDYAAIDSSVDFEQDPDEEIAA